MRREKKHQSVEGVKKIEGSEVRGRYQAVGLCGKSPVGRPGAYLVSISQLQTGDDLAFQLRVILGLRQDAVTEFRDVCFTGLPQHRV